MNKQYLMKKLIDSDDDNSIPQKEFITPEFISPTYFCYLMDDLQ